MMVEGDEDVERFLNRLAESMADNIDSVEQYNEAETGEFDGFEIRQ
jgi:hypothetical protein